MDTQYLAVIINGVEVYQQEIESHKSMMLGHQLQSKFCIQRLKDNGVDAGVWVYRGNGLVEIRNTQYDDKGCALIAQSRMNNIDFVPDAEWYDDKLKD